MLYMGKTNTLVLNHQLSHFSPMFENMVFIYIHINTKSKKMHIKSWSWLLGHQSSLRHIFTVKEISREGTNSFKTWMPRMLLMARTLTGYIYKCLYNAFI